MQSVAAAPIVLDRTAIAALPGRRLAGLEAARSTLLWRSGDSVAGILEVDPGGTLAPHCHVGAHHHMWVDQGTCTILGHDLGPGAYVHVPAGAEHGVSGVGPEGCRIVYLYVVV